MHVVILAEFAVASGGAEKVAVESARALAEAGVAVSFVQGVAGPADPLLDHPGIARIPLGLPDVWDLPASRAVVAGIWHADAARRLRAALDRLPDAVHCIHLHQWTRAFSPSVFPVLLGRGVPVAVTLHDYALACPNGVYYRFDEAEPCRLSPLGPACLLAPCDPKSGLHKAVRTLRSAATRLAVRSHVLDVVHVCDASVARIGGLLGPVGVRHHRVDNPVRVAANPPAEPERGDAIVYVGRLTAEKGAHLMADAARRAGLPALFVGAGPLEAELRGAGADVLGWMSPADLEAVLRTRARAVCAPSRWYETGPLTVYEALAMGIPVVASARAGASEKILDGTTGWRVEPDVDALAQAFGRLRDDAAVARAGRAAHAAYWAAPLDLPAHARALVGLYRSLAERRQGRSAAPERAGLGAPSAA